MRSEDAWGMCVCGKFACGRLESRGSRKYVELLAFHQYNNYCYYYDYYVVVLLFFHTSLWQCVNVYEIIFLWATIATSSSQTSLCSLVPGITIMVMAICL